MGGCKFLELGVLEPAIAAVVLETKVTMARQLADRDVRKLVFRTVRALAGVLHSSRLIVPSSVPLRTTEIFGF